MNTHTTTSTDIFSELSLVLDNTTDPFPIVFLPEEKDEKFGILTIKTIKIDNKQPLYMLFTIDRTESMNECTSTFGLSKLQQVKLTFINILKYLSNMEKEIIIQVNCFDTEVCTVIETTTISKCNISTIICIIESISTRGCTNLEIALVEANKTLSQVARENPSYLVNHIFMTDGDPNQGISCPRELAKLVNTEFPNIFIGFGIHHNAVILQALSACKNAEYQFIDNSKNTSIVYAETIYQLLFPAIKNLKIVIKNGKIYNWRTNDWEDHLLIPTVISEKEIIVHVVGSREMEVELYDEYTLLDTTTVLPELLDISTGIYETTDLTRYMYRQVVQDLLFRAKQLNQQRFESKTVIDKVFPNQNESFDNVKSQIRNVFRTMHKYMRETDLLNDEFMILLCDDLNVIYKTLGKYEGIAYSSSRHTSQGSQRSYSANIDESNDYSANNNKRQYAESNDYSANNNKRQYADTYCSPPKLVRASNKVNDYHNIVNDKANMLSFYEGFYTKLSSLPESNLTQDDNDVAICSELEKECFDEWEQSEEEDNINNYRSRTYRNTTFDTSKLLEMVTNITKYNKI